jgi:hypothetical protein
MKLQSEKLVRLIEVHNKIMAWHLENIGGLEVAIGECDKQHANTLVSMEHMASIGLAKGPNYSRIFSEIKDRRAKLVKAVQATKAEHARINAIVDRLDEKKSEVQSDIDQFELEESIDEWSNSQASFS